MILVKPSFAILTPIDMFDHMLARIEAAGRTCYKSEGKATPDSRRNFVTTLIARGHESVLEHESISVRIVCDRGVSHEIVRHRLASFSQESTRYCDYAKGHVCFVLPPWSKVDPGVYGHEGRYHIPWPYTDILWISAMRNAESAYLDLRKGGWSPQQARAVLPNSLKTEIVVTANLREWRHILRLRTSSAAHPQMVEIMRPLGLALSDLVPVVFDFMKPVSAPAGAA
jgi:thymidylate synthase (FAD)